MREKRNCKHMWRNAGVGFLLLVLLVTVTGCQLTQSPFTRMAGDAGAAFAAASITLTYAHQGKFTTAYASSAFVNYRSELDGLDQLLPSQQGAPDKTQIEHLLELYKQAIKVVDNPCLETSCDWRRQVEALNRASEAFVKAGGS
jgi:hypothetical protein